MSPVEAKHFLEDNQVKFILAQFVDIHGTAKTKAVPASHYEDILDPGAGFAGFAVWGLAQQPNSPDFMAVGDPATLSIVPWMPGFARMVCVGHVKGEPYPYDSRFVLMQQLERLKEKGWTLNVGIEPEFSLLRKDEHGRIFP
ncbi:MAG: type III glutamate--ammonia ligase, partial [Microcoleus sp. SIO2G3]|nr:type III glutamate--ammonia ligase [Microcoleus sp. SIO2G3]